MISTLRLASQKKQHIVRIKGRSPKRSKPSTIEGISKNMKRNAMKNSNTPHNKSKSSSELIKTEEITTIITDLLTPSADTTVLMEELNNNIIEAHGNLFDLSSNGIKKGEININSFVESMKGSLSQYNKNDVRHIIKLLSTTYLLGTIKDWTSWTLILTNFILDITKELELSFENTLDDISTVLPSMEEMRAHAVYHLGEDSIEAQSNEFNLDKNGRYSMNDFLTKLKENAHDLANFLKGPWGAILCSIISYIVIKPFAIADNFEITATMLKSFKEGLMTVLVGDNMDLIMMVSDTLTYYMEVGWNFFTGNEEPVKYKKKMTVPQWHAAITDLDQKEIFARDISNKSITKAELLYEIDTLIIMGKYLQQIARYKNKFGIITSQLASLSKRRLKLLMILRNEEGRKRPLGILLHGPTGVGKSFMIDLLINIHCAFRGQEFNARKKYSIPTDSEYWTGFTGQIYGVLDDVGAMNANHGGEASIVPIIRIVNEYPYVPTQAAVEDKGVYAVNFELLICSSNVQDLNIEKYASCPAAVLSRLKLNIGVQASPKYRARPEEPESCIDPVKLQEYEAVHGDAPDDLQIFTITEYYAPNGNHAQHVYKRVALINSMKEFRLYMMKVYAEHDKRNSFSDVSKERMLRPMCRCTKYKDECNKTCVFTNVPESISKKDTDDSDFIGPKRLSVSDVYNLTETVLPQSDEIDIGEEEESTHNLPSFLNYEDDLYLDADYMYQGIDVRNFVTRFTGNDVYFDTMEEWITWLMFEMPWISYEYAKSIVVSCFNLAVFIMRCIKFIRSFELYTWITQLGLFFIVTITQHYLLGTFLVFYYSWKVIKFYYWLVSSPNASWHLERQFNARYGPDKGKQFFKTRLFKDVSIIVMAIGAAKLYHYILYPTFSDEVRGEMMYKGSMWPSESRTALFRAVDAPYKAQRQARAGEVNVVRQSEVTSERECVATDADKVNQSFWNKEDLKIIKLDPQHAGSGMHVDHLEARIRKNDFFINVKAVGSDKMMVGRAIKLASNLYWASGHTFPDDLSKVSINITSESISEINSNNTVECIAIGPSTVMRLEGTDHIFIRSDYAPLSSDLSRFLIDDCIPGDASMFTVLPDRTISAISSLIKFPLVGLELIGRYGDCNEEMPIKGDSGSVTYSRAPSGELYIVGHHAGTESNTIFTEILTKSQFKTVVDYFEDKGPSILNVVCQNAETVGPPPRNARLTFVQAAICEYYGAHVSGSHQSFVKTKFVPSIFKEVVEEEFGPTGFTLPKFNSTIYNGVWCDPIKWCIEDRTSFKQPFDETFVQYSMMSYLSRFDGRQEYLEKMVHVLTDAEALNGADSIPYVDQLKRSTSAGHPFNVSKTHYLEPIKDSDKVILSPEMKLLYDKIHEGLLKGEVVAMIFKAHLKDEVRKISKVEQRKQRVFTGCNMIMTLLVRKYFGGIVRFLHTFKEDSEMSVGINCTSSEWKDLYNQITRFGSTRMLCGDYKSFDTSISPQIMKSVLQILTIIAMKSGNYSQEDIVMMTLLGDAICFPYISIGGELYRFYGGNPSGHPLTVVFNCIANSLYMRMSFQSVYDIGTFSDRVALATYGDDNIASVHEDCPNFNQQHIGWFLGVHGLTYTLASKEAIVSPYLHIDECDYLKRKFVMHEGIMCAPLDLESMKKSLCFRQGSKSISPEESRKEMLTNFLRESVSHGRTVYEHNLSLVQVWIEDFSSQVKFEVPTEDWRVRAEEMYR